MWRHLPAATWPTGRSHQPIDRRMSLGRSPLILHWIDKIPKKNIFQWIFQKVHKNYPSVGWSRIFLYSLVPIVVADHRLATQIIVWQSWFRCNRLFALFCPCIKDDGALYLHMWYSTLAYDGVFVTLLLTGRSRVINISSLVDPSRIEVGHPWNRPLAYTTHSCHSAQQTKQHTAI